MHLNEIEKHLWFLWFWVVGSLSFLFFFLLLIFSIISQRNLSLECSIECFIEMCGISFRKRTSNRTRFGLRTRRNYVFDYRLSYSFVADANSNGCFCLSNWGWCYFVLIFLVFMLLHWSFRVSTHCVGNISHFLFNIVHVFNSIILKEIIKKCCNWIKNNTFTLSDSYTNINYSLKKSLSLWHNKIEISIIGVICSTTRNIRLDDWPSLMNYNNAKHFWSKWIYSVSM